MKTVVILATYVGVVNRGAETFVIEIVKKLSKEYNFEVYSLGSCREIEDSIVKIDLKLPFWFTIHSKMYNNIYLYRYVCNYLYFLIPGQIEQYYFSKTVFQKHLKGRNDIDLIFPNNGLYGAKLANKIRKQNKTPFIYTGHGGIGEGEKRILLQNPDGYIALTDVHEIWARKMSNKIIKIHNGVDIENFKPYYVHKDKAKKVVLCVAALTQFKRQKLLIDAVEKIDNVELILIGNGEMKNEISNYGIKKLPNRFSLLSVPYGDIYKYYAMCDVFSLPSFDEPFGIVYLEALSMNKPIVAPDDSSRREIIGDAGLFCNVEDAFEYSETLKTALHKDWKDIPRNRVTLNFSWDTISNQYKKVIQDLTNK